MVIVILCSLFCFAYAEESDKISHQDSPWTGKWVDTNYTLSLYQNGSVVSGIATVFDSTVAEPFKLSGKLSEDGKTLQCITTETGTLTLNLSEDKMLFYGTGTVNAVDNGGEHFSYTFNATRNGTIIPDQDWTGIWASNRNFINLIQNGSTVTGDYHALSSTQFGGYVEGNISTDGKTLSMIWISPVQDTFSLSDDGKYLIEGECTDEKLSVNGYCFNLTKKE